MFTGNIKMICTYIFSEKDNLPIPKKKPTTYKYPKQQKVEKNISEINLMNYQTDRI